MNLRDNFIYFYNETFKTDPLYSAMAETSENSPWHRERNVAVHTDMVVSQYISRSPQTWTVADLLGALTCAFHDVGKPGAMEHVYSEQRGWYKRFAGHEKLSARLWEDWAVRNIDTLNKYFELDSNDCIDRYIWAITWMTEYHVPWGIKKPNKRNNLIATVYKIDSREVNNSFIRVLLADTYGRISDDAETKQTASEQWCEEFISDLRKYAYTYDGDANPSSRKCLHVLIGPPGSGKSTAVETITGLGSSREVAHYSLDDLRIDWYGDNSITDPTDKYNSAWKRAQNDKEFVNKAQQEYMRILKSFDNTDWVDFVVDNTNGSIKYRQFYINEARKRGFRVIGWVFPNTLAELIDRQNTRSDKTIPSEVVTRMYYNQNAPSYGEFDDIVATNTGRV